MSVSSSFALDESTRETMTNAAPPRATGGDTAVWRAAKRVLDIAVSVSLLALGAPLLMVVAAAVKLNSPGPAFFRQERVGLHHRPFIMFKFRSMSLGAQHELHRILHLNEADGPIFKVRADPRITPLGRFLRRSSLDELPQLVNVMRGEMSLVGPRPHQSAEVAVYSEPHRRRLSVKPGMTGLAQISGRSDLSWEDTVTLDLHYIDQWNSTSDIRILARTVKTVFRATGAA